MTTPSRPAGSSLTTAAEALEAALSKLQEQTESLRSARFDSQKNLERAAQRLREIADVDERIGLLVQDMVAAFQQSRDRQQSCGKEVAARARELEGRAEAFQGLMMKYAELGRDAAKLNELLQ